MRLLRFPLAPITSASDDARARGAAGVDLEDRDEAAIKVETENRTQSALCAAEPQAQPLTKEKQQSARQHQRVRNPGAAKPFIPRQLRSTGRALAGNSCRWRSSPSHNDKLTGKFDPYRAGRKATRKGLPDGPILENPELHVVALADANCDRLERPAQSLMMAAQAERVVENRKGRPLRPRPERKSNPPCRPGSPKQRRGAWSATQRNGDNNEATPIFFNAVPRLQQRRVSRRHGLCRAQYGFRCQGVPRGQKAPSSPIARGAKPRARRRPMVPILESPELHIVALVEANCDQLEGHAHSVLMGAQAELDLGLQDLNEAAIEVETKNSIQSALYAAEQQAQALVKETQQCARQPHRVRDPRAAEPAIPR